MPHALLRPREVTPGSYAGEIIDASLQHFQWRVSPENPLGVCLRVFIEIEADCGPAHVSDCVDTNHPARIRAIFEAASLPFDSEWQSRLDDLVGRRAIATVKNIRPRLGRGAGRSKAVVSSWISGCNS